MLVGLASSYWFNQVTFLKEQSLKIEHFRERQADNGECFRKRRKHGLLWKAITGKSDAIEIKANLAVKSAESYKFKWVLPKVSRVESSSFIWGLVALDKKRSRDALFASAEGNKGICIEMQVCMMYQVEMLLNAAKAIGRKESNLSPLLLSFSLFTILAWGLWLLFH